MPEQSNMSTNTNSDQDAQAAELTQTGGDVSQVLSEVQVTVLYPSILCEPWHLNSIVSPGRCE